MIGKHEHWATTQTEQGNIEHVSGDQAFKPQAQVAVAGYEKYKNESRNWWWAEKSLPTENRQVIWSDRMQCGNSHTHAGREENGQSAWGG
jgi:hypothetical protein